ncbi:MAG: hypothetical protein HQ472_01760 [Ignavibacteria bacterium]|nr:hypothetical protein [Ignavibacteria bacterium]
MLSFKSLLVIAPLLFAFSACSEQSTVPKQPDEAVITTVRVMLVDSATSDTTFYTWEDADGIGGNPPNRTDTMRLKTGSVYKAAVQFLSVQATGLVDVTPTIVADAIHHQVFFSVAPSAIAIVTSDFDANGKPLGIHSSLRTSVAGNASVVVALSHFPDAALKDGVTPSDETDVNVTFAVEVR